MVKQLAAVTGLTVSFQSETAQSDVKPPFPSLDREPEYCHISHFSEIVETFVFYVFLNAARMFSASDNYNMRISGTGHAFGYGNSFLWVVGAV